MHQVNSLQEPQQLNSQIGVGESFESKLKEMASMQNEMRRLYKGFGWQSVASKKSVLFATNDTQLDEHNMNSTSNNFSVDKIIGNQTQS